LMRWSSVEATQPQDERPDADSHVMADQLMGPDSGAPRVRPFDRQALQATLADAVRTAEQSDTQEQGLEDVGPVVPPVPSVPSVPSAAAGPPAPTLDPAPSTPRSTPMPLASAPMGGLTPRPPAPPAAAGLAPQTGSVVDDPAPRIGGVGDDPMAGLPPIDLDIALPRANPNRAPNPF